MAQNKLASDCCPTILQPRLGRADAEELATAFRALGDPGRLQLLSFLAAQPDGEACVCNLVAPTGLTQPTVSHHLRVLTESGLLERERRGTWIYYRLATRRLDALRAALQPASASGRRRSAAK